jgi:hypothetical protein
MMMTVAVVFLIAVDCQELPATSRSIRDLVVMDLRPDIPAGRCHNANQIQPVHNEPNQHIPGRQTKSYSSRCLLTPTPFFFSNSHTVVAAVNIISK